MAVALPTPPLRPPPSTRRCRFFSCALPQSDSPSSATSTPCRRPAVILPGLGNNTNDYQKLGLILKDYGVPSVIAKVSRIDWLRNAAGLVDTNYWKGTLRPRPVLNWYLKRVEEAVNEAKELVPDSSISLIGHSAGGWLARVYLQEYGASDVSLLLTLGTPHLAPPKGVSGVIDQTRGLLNYVEKNCAKAVYSPELRYVCIAGRYIQGVRFLGLSDKNGSVDLIELDQQVGETVAVNTSVPASASLQARFIGQGYKQVCGLADVWGDGVVPEMSAHLDGALNITLDGVYHSPVGSDDEKRPCFSTRNFRGAHKVTKGGGHGRGFQQPRGRTLLVLRTGGGGGGFLAGGGDVGLRRRRCSGLGGGVQGPAAPEKPGSRRHWNFLI